MPRLLYKETTGANKTQKNFLFRLTKNCTVTIFWCLSIFALNPTSISGNYTIQDRFLTYNNFNKKKIYKVP